MERGRVTAEDHDVVRMAVMLSAGAREIPRRWMIEGWMDTGRKETKKIEGQRH